MNFSKDKLLEIGTKKRNGELPKDHTWQYINEKYCDNFFENGERVREWVKNQLRKQSINKDASKSEFKEEFEIHKDGSHSSSKLIRLSLEQKKNPRFLLEAHGFDPEEWELINVKASEWTGYSKQDQQFPMYASKITVRPLQNKFTYEKLLEVISNIKPLHIKIERNIIKHKDRRMLEVPLFDPHFGISDYEYYKDTQLKILHKIENRKWEEILFVIGQDMIHNNDHKGRTANGTQIEQVDMEKAWEDCRRFYEPIIESAIINSNKVKIVYSKGNHDETISWAFVKMLKVRFPNAVVDDSFIERKFHVFGQNFIGITHGDKGRKNLHNIFPVEFPIEWANAKNREIHCGHLHIEDAKDVFGMMVRTLSTRNKTDQWHRDNGYVGGHKRFMLFEYSLEELESIHYV